MSSGISLYQLGEEFRALEQLAWEAGGEDSPELEAWFVEYGALEADKIDSYASFIRELTAYEKALDEELALLQKKQRVAKRLIEKLKARVKSHLWERRLTEIAGRIWKFCRQNDGGLAPLEVLVPLAELPAEFVYVPPPEQDGAKLRAALAAAKEDPDAPIHKIARLGERGWHVRVR